MLLLEKVKEFVAENGKVALRPSSLQQFINCPLQWAMGALLHDYRKPKAASEAGSSLHKGAEVGYAEKIKTGKLPPLSVVTDAVRDEWKARNEADEIIYPADEDYNSIQAELIQDTATYYPIMVETTPKAVEKRYSFDIDHPIFSGVSGVVDIDLVNGIADIKRTSKKTTAAHYLLQQSTYAWLKSVNGDICIDVTLHNVVKTKQVTLIPVDVNVDYAKYIINTILDVTEEFWNTGNTMLFRGSNPVSNYLCSPKWCGYWGECQHVKFLRS